MGDDIATRFRERARECRKIADEAKTADWRESLLTMAKDLEDEADNMDAEDNPD